jgi:hypothetical protein
VKKFFKTVLFLGTIAGIAYALFQQYASKVEESDTSWSL